MRWGDRQRQQECHPRVGQIVLLASAHPAAAMLLVSAGSSARSACEGYVVVRCRDEDGASERAMTGRLDS